MGRQGGQRGKQSGGCSGYGGGAAATMGVRSLGPAAAACPGSGDGLALPPPPLLLLSLGWHGGTATRVGGRPPGDGGEGLAQGPSLLAPRHTRSMLASIWITGWP